MTRKQLLLLIALIPLCAAAQVTYEPKDYSDDITSSLDLSKMSFGIKISPAISWVDIVNNDMQADGAALKIGIGGVVNYDIKSHFALISGINYNYYGGYAYDQRSLNAKDTLSSFRLNYKEVEVPFLIKLRTTKVNNLSYFLQGGLSAGFILTSNEKRTPVNKSSQPLETDLREVTVPTRLNYILGAGMDYYIGSKSYLFGSVNYKKSINNIAYGSVYSNGRYTSPVQIFPGNMEISIGIMF